MKDTFSMSLLKAYLSNSSTQRILSIKPGDKGFSLIELVVVVAVLAILAAIAIPSFTSINQEARVAGAKTALANLAKECAVKLVGSGSKTFITPTLDTYAISSTTGKANTCGTADVYAATDGSGGLPTFSYTVSNSSKTCAAGSTTTSPDRMLGCNASSGSTTTGTW